MFKYSLFFMIFSSLFFQAACGFKGNLYRTTSDDNASFGAVQTGIGLQAPNEKNKAQNPQK